MILTMTGEKLSSRDGIYINFIDYNKIMNILFSFFKVDMMLKESNNASKDGRVNYENLLKVLSTPISQN
jgi:hypothetical protein